MQFEKLIGKSFEQIKSALKPYKIENNHFILELEEGVEEEFFVNARDKSFEMILTKNKIIQTIFIFPNEKGEFPFRDFHVNMGRAGVRKRFGFPDKENSISNKIIGKVSGFDRFDKEIVYHFEYKNENQTRLKQITLMSLDAAP